MEFVTAIASNKIFIGLAMLMTNMGSRYVISDLGKFNEKILSHQIVKKITVFCMFFVGTRDILTSLILTFAFILVIDGLLNEKSMFSLVARNKFDNPEQSTPVVRKYDE